MGRHSVVGAGLFALPTAGHVIVNVGGAASRSACTRRCSIYLPGAFGRRGCWSKRLYHMFSCRSDRCNPCANACRGVGFALFSILLGPERRICLFVCGVAPARRNWVWCASLRAGILAPPPPDLVVIVALRRHSAQWLKLSHRRHRKSDCLQRRPAHVSHIVGAEFCR